MRKTLLITLLLISFPLMALPLENRVPGGIALIAIDSAQAPKAWFNKRAVLVTPHQNQWLAVVGIPLKTKPGIYHLRVKHGNTTLKKPFKVSGKHYPEQRIKLKNKRMVNPKPVDMQRIKRERKHLGQVLATWSHQDAPLDFALPVTGRLSSPFGLRRFFNDQPRNPHSGLDIAAPRGTPIQVPAAGVVIDSGNYYFNGNTVLIDHGQGLISGYFHLDQTRVKIGQQVKTGDILGTIGDTGRVTGPHLHWNIYLNRARVDPALFVQGQLDALKKSGGKL